MPDANYTGRALFLATQDEDSAICARSTLQMTRVELQQHRDNHTRENSWWVNDARGIPLCRVCDKCEEAALAEYKPAVIGRGGRYEDVVEDVIEDD